LLWLLTLKLAVLLLLLLLLLLLRVSLLCLLLLMWLLLLRWLLLLLLWLLRLKNYIWSLDQGYSPSSLILTVSSARVFSSLLQF
jgi:hypothetical protein